MLHTCSILPLQTLTILFILLNILQVFDKDVGQDERLGLVKLPLSSLEAGVTKELELNLLSSLDTLKVKDKKDRGSITLKVYRSSLNKLQTFSFR